MFIRSCKKYFIVETIQFFGKVGRTSSEKVIIELIKNRCIAILLYGLEACHLAQLRSLDFVVNRLYTKLLTTNNIEIVRYCQYYLGFNLPSEMLAKRTDKFEKS